MPPGLELPSSWNPVSMSEWQGYSEKNLGCTQGQTETQRCCEQHWVSGLWVSWEE